MHKFFPSLPGAFDVAVTAAGAIAAEAIGSLDPPSLHTAISDLKVFL